MVRRCRADRQTPGGVLRRRCCHSAVSLCVRVCSPALLREAGLPSSPGTDEEVEARTGPGASPGYAHSKWPKRVQPQAACPSPPPTLRGSGGQSWGQGTDWAGGVSRWVLRRRSTRLLQCCGDLCAWGTQWPQEPDRAGLLRGCRWDLCRLRGFPVSPHWTVDKRSPGRGSLN